MFLNKLQEVVVNTNKAREVLSWLSIISRGWKVEDTTSSKVLLQKHHQWFSVTKGVLRKSVKSTGKHLCQSLFFDKVAGLGGPNHIETSSLICVLESLSYKETPTGKSVNWFLYDRDFQGQHFYYKRDSGTGAFLWILQNF